MAQLSDCYQEIRAHANTCPDFTLDFALNRAIREFCRETWVHEVSTSITMVDSQATYQLGYASNNEVIAVQAAQLNDTTLRPARAIDVRPSDTGEPTTFIFEPPNYITLSPTPTSTEAGTTVDVRTVVQPKEDSDNVPDIIYRLYKPYIIYGALGWIYDMPEEVWTDFNKAAQYKQLFYAGVSEAKVQRSRGYVPRELRMKPRTFL